jgi:hypothetical protein
MLIIDAKSFTLLPRSKPAHMGDLRQGSSSMQAGVSLLQAFHTIHFRQSYWDRSDIPVNDRMYNCKLSPRTNMQAEVENINQSTEVHRPRRRVGPNSLRARLRVSGHLAPTSAEPGSYLGGLFK